MLVGHPPILTRTGLAWQCVVLPARHRAPSMTTDTEVPSAGVSADSSGRLPISSRPRSAGRDVPPVPLEKVSQARADRVHDRKVGIDALAQQGSDGCGE